MKRLSTPHKCFSHLLLSLAICALPFHASALEAPAGDGPPVIITELQTGAATASDEFIEIYNRSSQTVDIGGWQVRSSSPLLKIFGTVPLSVDGGPVLLASHNYYTFYTSSLATAALHGSMYDAALTKSDKSVSLYAYDRQQCLLAAQDTVAWRSPGSTTTLDSEGAPLVVPQEQVSKDKLIVRYRDGQGQYVDVNDNAHDFILMAATASPRLGVALEATPGADNIAVIPALAGEPTSSVPTLAPLPIAGCVVPAPPTVSPSQDPPDDTDPPAPPQGDDTGQPPVSSGDDSPSGMPTDYPGVDPPAEDAADGVPQVGGNSGLLAPQLTELLPNPASPQTDEHDEFIELFNPNNMAFDLSGYALEAGTTTTHRYVFPAGAQLPPQSYEVLYPSLTGLSLANSGGQVRILDTHQVKLAQTDVYGMAKDGQAWALVDASWQWTDEPTPGAANVAHSPNAVTTKSVPTGKPAAVKSAKTTTAKVITAKAKAAAPAKASKKTVVEAAKNLAVAEPSKGSLHTGVIAVVAGFALLYGAYEYRTDLAHRFHQFRANRTDRRRFRQKSARG